MTPRAALPLLAPLLLAACQAAGPAAPSTPEARPAGRAIALSQADARTCRGLGAFAVVVADGRRGGVPRTEALQSARAGPLTELFETIVNGVYDAPRPTTAGGWEALRRTYGAVTAAGCAQALSA